MANERKRKDLFEQWVESGEVDRITPAFLSADGL